MQAPRESPRPSQRKLDRAPLYLQDDSRSTLEQPELDMLECSQKPLVITRQILQSSRSLDPFPSQLRRRTDTIKITIPMTKRSTRSLDGGVAMISNDPNCESPTITKISYKHLNNNCNGSVVGVEDPNCPLLFRQGSLNSPQDESLYQTQWRSLQAVCGGAEDLQSKKALHRGSIRSWLFGLFQGNGIRASNSSLRKVGVMQSGVRGLPGFGELPSAPENESVV